MFMAVFLDNYSQLMAFTALQVLILFWYAFSSGAAWGNHLKTGG
jgi:hypothetical protein